MALAVSGASMTLRITRKATWEERWRLPSEQDTCVEIEFVDGRLCGLDKRHALSRKSILAADLVRPVLGCAGCLSVHYVK